MEIKCPYDLNRFILGEPIFENTFPEEECEQRKFYGDCHHCFSTAIACRDRQLKNIVKQQSNKDVLDNIKAEIIEKFDNCSICEWFEDYDYDENDISEYISIGHISDIIDIIDKYGK